jgi:trigger factor
MKKLLNVLLAFSLIFIMSACGVSDEEVVPLDDVLKGGVFFTKEMFGSSDPKFADDVDQFILEIQINLADEITGQPIVDSDVVIINFVGYLDGEAFEGGSANDFRLKIGSRLFIDDFEEQLIGYSKGDLVEVIVTFPVDYGFEALNGREAIFNVEIVDVFKLRERNDELAQKYAELAKAYGFFEAAEIRTMGELRSFIEAEFRYMREVKQ